MMAAGKILATTFFAKQITLRAKDGSNSVFF